MWSSSIRQATWTFSPAWRLCRGGTEADPPVPPSRPSSLSPLLDIHLFVTCDILAYICGTLELRVHLGHTCYMYLHHSSVQNICDTHTYKLALLYISKLNTYIRDTHTYMIHTLTLHCSIYSKHCIHRYTCVYTHIYTFRYRYMAIVLYKAIASP